ncbi:DUF3515 family protein [Rathayibacter iranicus]|uniref:DUF3515 domain-containing protein n=1 Tax=Rathayibacter iranicus TaxID=59737 RepID=A0AAD1AEJ9_9MICO|nr:DUF3515 family protein [Rathayibacter iranicus]AZZ55520.1 DUF3515 domain-containing protein [Rathayibacter iranicus]MWV31649.1 DUF3515 family protein [Rathayibacter iranicus NCPPB 2253 = VKM Ac-1602]PPI48309.1 DUF3515 domain-containing protein [Rathayibacter iranicus]PPI60940.1 DUF3515 domain-containing protein [Rathayibacter iranicus]PPI72531.1 DUF3515 domain-containing protein [Rathayibacter iranicus]
MNWYCLRTPRERIVRSTALVVTIVTGMFVLSGCSPTVALEPAQDAASVGCASVSARLPDALDDGNGGEIARRETSAQGTAAWGSPAIVLLRCGIEPPAADPRCLNVDGIDWIPDDTDAPNYRFITFGRDPAIEVIIDSEKISGSTVLDNLNQAVNGLAPSGGLKCKDLQDVP